MERFFKDVCKTTCRSKVWVQALVITSVSGRGSWKQEAGSRDNVRRASSTMD
jgi:hypothetical protein